MASDRSSAFAELVRDRLARSRQVKLPMARGIRPGQERMFPPAAHLLNAEDHRARCAILVGLPDAMVVSHFGALDKACRAVGFTVGADFLAVRQAALLARRDADGALPASVAEQLRFWTGFMAGQRRVSP